jgi:hypothetical protein
MSEQRAPAKKTADAGETPATAKKKQPRGKNGEAAKTAAPEKPDPEQLNGETRVNRRDQPRRYTRPGNPAPTSPPEEPDEDLADDDEA